jgi:hypothetical protein
MRLSTVRIPLLAVSVALLGVGISDAGPCSRRSTSSGRQPTPGGLEGFAVPVPQADRQGGPR